MPEEFQVERHPLIDRFDESPGEDGILLEEDEGVFRPAHAVHEAPETILRGVSPEISLQARHLEFQDHRAAHHGDQPLGQASARLPLDRPAIERQLAELPAQGLDPLAQPGATVTDDRFR